MNVINSARHIRIIKLLVASFGPRTFVDFCCFLNEQEIVKTPTGLVQNEAPTILATQIDVMTETAETKYTTGGRLQREILMM